MPMSPSHGAPVAGSAGAMHAFSLDEEEEEGIFALDSGGGGGGDDDDDAELGGFHLAGMGDSDNDEPPDDVQPPVLVGVGQLRKSSGSDSPVLGASPTLLTILEKVAEASGSKR